MDVTDKGDYWNLSQIVLKNFFFFKDGVFIEVQNEFSSFLGSEKLHRIISP